MKSTLNVGIIIIIFITGCASNKEKKSIYYNRIQTTVKLKKLFSAPTSEYILIDYGLQKPFELFKQI